VADPTLNSAAYFNFVSKCLNGSSTPAGNAVAADLTAMPHLLIAGAAGSGKSVSVNALISCLLLNNTPDDLRLQGVFVSDSEIQRLVQYWQGFSSMATTTQVVVGGIVGPPEAGTGTRQVLDYGPAAPPADEA
jgi:DNA segregation ATPase FtsK/SpoIIIE-like protein